MRPRKRFGQNFLVDPSICQRIVDSLALKPTDTVVEIGPGHGALTELLMEQLDSATAVELDRDLIPMLRARFDNLELIQADVLDLDFADLLSGGNVRLVGNLPYNISSPLLIALLPHAKQLRDATFMLQREMAARLVAEPSTKAWGRLGVQVQLDFEVDWLLDVPPESFNPVPKVDSAVVRLRPRESATIHQLSDRKLFGQLLTSAFNARRKTLRNALKAYELDFESLGVLPTQRPDATTLAQFVALANAASSS